MKSILTAIALSLALPAIAHARADDGPQTVTRFGVSYGNGHTKGIKEGAITLPMGLYNWTCNASSSASQSGQSVGAGITCMSKDAVISIVSVCDVKTIESDEKSFTLSSSDLKDKVTFKVFCQTSIQ